MVVSQLKAGSIPEAVVELCRVLEKAGYVLEARLRRSAIKDGRLVDQMQYAYIVEG